MAIQRSQSEPGQFAAAIRKAQEASAFGTAATTATQADLAAGLIPDDGEPDVLGQLTGKGGIELPDIP